MDTPVPIPNTEVKHSSGEDSRVDTPVPIPNTEVKHSSGEDSLTAKQARCRVKGRHCLLFFYFCFSSQQNVTLLQLFSVTILFEVIIDEKKRQRDYRI